MLFVVRLTLSVLRIATHASLFLEAQRVLLRLVRPVRRDIVARLEHGLLSNLQAHVEHRWVIDDRGHKIHALEAKPTVASKESDNQNVMILLHGHSMAAAYWYRNVDHFVGLGYRVIAIDLLGWGRSHRPQFVGSTPDDTVNWFVSSIAAVIPALLGVDSSQLSSQFVNLTVIGHSLGAYIAYEFTRRYHLYHSRICFKHLVLVSPAASVRQIPLSRAVYFSLTPQTVIRRGGLLGFLLFVAKYPRQEPYVRDRLRDLTYYLAAQSPPSGEVAVRPIINFLNWRSAECTRPLVENIVPKLEIPILVLCGDSDTSMPVEGVLQLYRRMKKINYDVSLSVIKNCDHCPQLEKPKHFFDAVVAFLNNSISVQHICISNT